MNIRELDFHGWQLLSVDVALRGVSFAQGYCHDNKLANYYG
jgi:hypothetical protein